MSVVPRKRIFVLVLMTWAFFYFSCPCGLESAHLKTSGETALPRKHFKHVNKSHSSEVTTFHLQGFDFGPNALLALTNEPGTIGSPCNESLFVLKNIHSTELRRSSFDVVVNAVLPRGSVGYLYLCVSNPKRSDSKLDARLWTHIGNYAVHPLARERREDVFEEDITGASIFGLRAEGDRVYIRDDGFTQIPANVNVTVRVFGANLSDRTEFAFTSTRQLKGSNCDNSPIVRIVNISAGRIFSENVVEVQLSLPLLSETKEYFICVKETYQKGNLVRWIHQGDDPWLMLEPVGRLLPMWLQICLIIFLLCLSGLFSGLNLGLMALDRLELQVIENCGTATEKKCARTISPLRNRGNYLLCSLLLGNVLVNSTLTILLDDLTSGVIAIVGSTISIVVIGEIIPQALCSRHGLSIGARTVWVTKFFMFATFPLSFPISKLLDCILGEEIGNVYDRERLMEYIRITKPYNKLENEEVNIISGALELKKKTVSNVMTKIEDVFMVPYDAVLNFETMSEIMKQGYSRIPVYDSDRNNIVALLNIKDLAFVDPDDNSPLRTLCEFYNHPINYVFEDETLDVMLNEFKKGQSHMAFVRRVNTEGDGDPFYEITGVVTLEDVIEEILQSEIIDETDVLTDNRRKQRRKEAQVKQDFSEFAKIGGGQQGKNCISPQLALATYQYLSTSVEPFKRMYLSETVLKRLMAQNIFFTVKQLPSSKDDYEPAAVLYESGKPADYFILILEGRCRVTVGKEKLVFETGPFSYFGLPALTLPSSTGDTQSCSISPQSAVRNSSMSISASFSPTDNGVSHSFIPDYTVVAVCETSYMKIHWTVYLAAYRATLMERQKLDMNSEESDAWARDIFITTANGQCAESGSVYITSKSFDSQLSRNVNKGNFISNSNITRRASVECGFIIHATEVTASTENSGAEKVNNDSKLSSCLKNADIPVTDINNSFHYSEITDKDLKGKGDVARKNFVDGLNTHTKKPSPVNGAKHSADECTKLLYPSEA